MTAKATRRILPCVVCAFLLRPAASAAQETGAPFKFETKVNVVLVPVLVRDAQGRAVGNLTKEDFRLFDKGKLQVISGFTMQTRAGQNSAAKIAPGASDGPATVNTTQAAVPKRFIAFLFDDLHLDPGDLAHVRRAATQMLADSLESTDIAAVLSTSGRINTGFTRDRAKLLEGVEKLQRVTNYAHVHSCPNVDHYQAYLIHDLNDPAALDAAIAEALRCLFGADRPTAEAMSKMAASTELAMAEQGTQVTLDVIRQVALQMGNLPGQRTLILISSGFIALTPAAMLEKERVTDAAAQAGVTINALDARALYTYMLDAGKNYESQEEEHIRKESLSAYGAAMDELASGVGGDYFQNSNDLEGGLKRLTMPPEYLYLLQFSPQSAKQDGMYHRLSVKVDKKGVKVRARPGYFADKTTKPKKAHHNG